MKKYKIVMKKIMGVLLFMIILAMPMVANAEPETEAPDGTTDVELTEESLISIDSFVMDSNEGEVYQATMITSAETEISFDYTIAVVTDISQEGKVVATGGGKTTEPTVMSIDMSGINTYDNYRYKITIDYNVDGQPYFTTGYSKVFEYTQESYAEELGGRDITVDMTGKVVNIDWREYNNRSSEAVLVIIEEDGTVQAEEVIYTQDQEYYKYYFDKDAGKLTITLKQVIDGRLSQGITDTILLGNDDTKETFYLEFPSDTAQYDTAWNVNYYNGAATQVYWRTDSYEDLIELNEDGAFIISMDDDNTQLVVDFADQNNVMWHYEFLTDLDVKAPTIDMLEAYDGSSVSASSIVLSGQIDDINATVKINDNEIETDGKGMFTGEVELSKGKNVITIEAANALGKTSRKIITVYRDSDGAIMDNGGLFGEYTPLIITAIVSVVLLVIMIVATKMKGGNENVKKKNVENDSSNEEEA